MKTKKNTNTNEQEKDESKSGGVVSDLGWLVYEVMKLSPVAKIKNHHVDTVGRGVVCACGRSPIELWYAFHCREVKELS